MQSTRRFFFDNGQSRKRWWLTVAGNMLSVQSGRITGKLRFSEKSYSSSEEAKTQADLMILRKRREGYIEVEPSRLEIVRNKGLRRATSRQIQELEKKVGSELPGEFKNFLVDCNGGRPNPDYVRIPGMAGIESVGVGSLFHLQPSKPQGDELTFEFDRTREMLPSGHLPIAGSSDMFTLSLTPRTFGAVYWWFHETELVDDDGNFLESAGYILASSFDEFLTRIATFYDSSENSERDTDAESRGTNRDAKVSVKRLLKIIQLEHTPKVVKEIKDAIHEVGDLSGIENGEWPFINLDNPEVLGCLLDAGLNPEILDAEGQSLLWQSASSPECIGLLAKHGANLDRRSGSRGETPLMRALFLQSSAAVQKLMKLGANPTLRLDRFLANDLEGNPKLLKILEKAKADWKRKPPAEVQVPKLAEPRPDASTRKRKGPKPTLKRLLQLMKHDHIQENEIIDGVEELVAELGDISGIEDGQWPAIDKFEDPRLLKILLDAGLNPEITDKSGKTLLSQCVSHPDCIDLIVNKGVEVDRRYDKAETALMRAVYVGDKECVQRLLDAGANPTLEFTGFAKVMLRMNEKMSAFMEAARVKWIRDNPS